MIPPRLSFLRPGWIRSVRLAAAVLVLGLLTAGLLAAEPPPGTLRVMTWNIHHGEGMDGRVDLARIAGVITNQQAHLVALQEVDKGVARTDRRDFPAELAALTGMTCVFSNNFAYQGGEYGNAILSRLPILSTTNRHLTMLRPAEQRGVLQATVQWGAHPVVFLNTHIDYRPDDAERLSNVKEFEALARQATNRLWLIAGDFNDHPGSRTHAAMARAFTDVWAVVGEGDGFTITSERPRSRIDYLWVVQDSPLRPVRTWIPATTASDHLPLVADFTLKP